MTDEEVRKLAQERGLMPEQTSEKPAAQPEQPRDDAGRYARSDDGGQSSELSEIKEQLAELAKAVRPSEPQPPKVPPMERWAAPEKRPLPSDDPVGWNRDVVERMIDSKGKRETARHARRTLERFMEKRTTKIDPRTGEILLIPK